ncbi:hypothetical protein CCACVL1_15221 [Corchorus capsularis]|uniref:Uncharacterized protein n=1 Tax=Corchorus capsularis TaxID=210143 RepID=A0A1R3I3C8_COCAP|nr:hypothetical protein CCACVL1_15221 [Corchorus capsularis]
MDYGLKGEWKGLWASELENGLKKI